MLKTWLAAGPIIAVNLMVGYVFGPVVGLIWSVGLMGVFFILMKSENADRNEWEKENIRIKFETMELREMYKENPVIFLPHRNTLKNRRDFRGPS